MELKPMSRPSTYNANSQWQPERSETTRLLKDSVRLAHETEDIGESTASNLISQRESLNNTRFYLDSMIQIGDEARDSVQAIRAKAYRRKFNLWLIIGFLTVANIYVIFQEIRNGGSLWPKKTS